MGRRRDLRGAGPPGPPGTRARVRPRRADSGRSSPSAAASERLRSGPPASRPKRRPSEAPAPPPQRRLNRGRALRVVVALLAAGGAAAGAYGAALDTSMFAVQRFDVVGAPPGVASQVEAMLAPELGRSLLKVSGATVDRLVSPLPDVASVRFRRVFPHTLRVEVVTERAVLLLRAGKLAYVVSSRGRVMALEQDPRASTLPRLWAREQLTIGETLTPSDGLLAAAAAAGIHPGLVPGGVRTVIVEGQDVTLVTPAGFQVRLGGVDELALKLAIVRRIVAYLGSSISSDAYLDVSVPARPVVGGENPQVEGVD